MTNVVKTPSAVNQNSIIEPELNGGDPGRWDIGDFPFVPISERGLHNSLFSRVCYEVANFIIDTSLQIALVNKLHSLWKEHKHHV